MTTIAANTSKIRILACLECKTLEELPWYEGNPDYDDTLVASTLRHRSAGIPHHGSLFVVEESVWNSPKARDEIRAKLVAQLDPNSTTGFGAETYAMVDNFRADAMECWGKHLRTPACPDYMSREKRLVPNTREERKELGLSPVYDEKDPHLTKFLCHYCPVHSVVQQAQRKQAGLYDD